MKKNIAMLLVAILCIGLFLTGCTGTTTTPGTSGTTSPNGVLAVLVLGPSPEDKASDSNGKGNYVPLSGAIFYVVGTDYSTTTDSNGYAAIDNVPAGTYTVTVGKEGYQGFSCTVVIAGAATTQVGPATGVELATSTAPYILNVNTLSGYTGTPVTITGVNFGSTQGTSTVKFNGTTARSITSWSSSQIACAAATGASTGNLVVTVGGVASNGVSFTVTTLGYAYVANRGTTTVSVIRTSDNTVLPTAVTVGTGPFGLAFTPDGNYVYVANFTSNSVSVIKTSDNSIYTTITASGDLAFNGPVYIAITPNGNYAYVTNWNSGKVSVIRTSDNTVTKTVTVGSSPDGLTITPDGNYVYVTNFGSTTVSVIRTSDNTVLPTAVTVGNAPSSVVITPDGNYAYVANYGSDTVSVIKISDNSIYTTIIDPVAFNGINDIAITPDGNYVYVVNKNTGTVSVIRASDNMVTKTMTVGTSPWSISITPDGSYAYVTNSGATSVSVIRTSDNTVLPATMAVGNTPQGIATK